ncbi:MAG: hypothetical protein ACREJG_02965, partial [Candidatus Rokuibacteriota bacterium]
MARKKSARRRRRRATSGPVPASSAEADLLALAREITALERVGDGAVPAALERLAEAYAPESPLPAVVF